VLAAAKGLSGDSVGGVAAFTAITAGPRIASKAVVNAVADVRMRCSSLCRCASVLAPVWHILPGEILSSSAPLPARALPAVAVALLLLASSCASAREFSDFGAAARAILGADQGVYVEAADGEILLAQAARRPVHPASVSKVPTTLALLHRLGPDYRFTTTFSGDGALHDGLLEGDLIVDGGGDPFFVDENALLVAARLRELGVHRIAGTLRVRGTLIFNWQAEAAEARLRAALSGRAPPSAWETVRPLTGVSPRFSRSVIDGASRRPGV